MGFFHVIGLIVWGDFFKKHTRPLLMWPMRSRMFLLLRLSHTYTHTHSPSNRLLTRAPPRLQHQHNRNTMSGSVVPLFCAQTPKRVQFPAVPQVANAQKHFFQHAGLLIINELLHHWQISLISQGRVWERTRRSDARRSARTRWRTRMQTECVWTCICSHPNTFYQSNLTGRSMIWLANRELMQSRVPPPHLLLSQSSLICLSHVPLLLRSLSLSAFSNLLFLYCGEQQNNSCTQSCRWEASSRPTGSVAAFAGISVNMVWSLLILFKREGTNRERRTCKHSSDRSEPTAAQINIRTGVWRFAFLRVYAIKHKKPAQ